MVNVACIIDNDADSAERLKFALVNHDYSVTTVTNPDKILNTLHRMYEINIIFLDFEIRDDGIVIYEMLRSMGIKAPILAYTSCLERRHELYQVGFDGLVPKPLDISGLPDKLKRVHAGESIW